MGLLISGESAAVFPPKMMKCQKKMNQGSPLWIAVADGGIIPWFLEKTRHCFDMVWGNGPGKTFTRSKLWTEIYLIKRYQKRCSHDISSIDVLSPWVC